MTEQSLHTTQLHHWLDRIQSGDRAARDELLRVVGHRLERLAHKMLRRYPAVHRWADTGDVLQNALLRLLRALEDVRPGSVRDFFGLAAEQMRRELLDLARHFHGPQGFAAHHESHDHDGTLSAPAVDPPASEEDSAELERWTAFHQGVAGLPAEVREVVELIFYHGWTQQAVAELLQISERTVRRRWESALRQLRGALQDSEP